MAVGIVTTTITVNFTSAAGGAGQGHLSAEVDSRPAGKNNGASQFAPGTPVHILVFKSNKVSIIGTLTSAGSLVANGTDTFITDDFVSFAQSKSITLSKPCSDVAPTVTWIGTQGGDLTLGEDQVTLTAASTLTAVCRLHYASKPDVYTLSGVPTNISSLTTFPVACVISGESA